MSRTGFGIGIAASALLLAGCGDSGDTNAGAEATSPGAEAAAQGPGATGAGIMPADWKATDACSIIDKAAIEQVLGTTVTESSLGLVHEPTAGGNDGEAECKYTWTRESVRPDGRRSRPQRGASTRTKRNERDAQGVGGAK